MSFETGCPAAIREMQECSIRSANRCITRLILIVAIATGPFLVSACSNGPQEPHQIIALADSLQVDGQTSLQNQRPVIVFVSQPGCEFCHLLRDKILHPMIAAGVLQQRVVLREVSLDESFGLIDFDGSNISGPDFAQRYQAAVTPTLLFLDSEGKEVAERIVGISNVEYYGFYLDKAIDAATTEIRRKL